MFAWGQDKCDIQKPTETITPDKNTGEGIESSAPSSDNFHPDQIIFSKSLDKVFSEFSHWDETNTLIVDDSPNKCPPRWRKNALHPPPISGYAVSTITLNRAGSCCNTVGERHSVDCDEENEGKQITFFERLAEYWHSEQHVAHGRTNDRSTSMSKLHFFLDKHAKGHMGWCGDDAIKVAR